MENGLKMRRVLLKPNVLHLGEGSFALVKGTCLILAYWSFAEVKVSWAWAKVMFAWANPRVVLLASFLHLSEGCLLLGKPPRLSEVVPSSTTSTFSSFSPFFAYFYFLFLQNISKWGISVIFRNIGVNLAFRLQKYM